MSIPDWNQILKKFEMMITRIEGAFELSKRILKGTEYEPLLKIQEQIIAMNKLFYPSFVDLYKRVEKIEKQLEFWESQL